MEVDLIGQPRVAGRVRRGHVLDLKRRAVRQNEALPHDACTPLTESHDAVVAAHKARTLRNEQDIAGRTVKNVLRHLCNDETGGSEERCAGKGGVTTSRSRWSPSHTKQRARKQVAEGKKEVNTV